MATYFSEDFKSSVRTALDNVHQSFARTVSLYHEYMQDLDPLEIHNNPLFGMPSTSTTRLTPIRTQTDISGVIRYFGNQDDEILSFGEVISGLLGHGQRTAIQEITQHFCYKGATNAVCRIK